MRHLIFIAVFSIGAQSALATLSSSGSVEVSEIFDGEMATVSIYGEAAKTLSKIISEYKSDKGIACSAPSAKSKKKSEFKCWFLVSKTGEVSSPGPK